MVNIPWGLYYQCSCSHGELYPTHAIPGDSPRPLGRFSPGNYGEGNGNQLQYFCLENPMDGGVW